MQFFFIDEVILNTARVSYSSERDTPFISLLVNLFLRDVAELWQNRNEVVKSTNEMSISHFVY